MVLVVSRSKGIAFHVGKFDQSHETGFFKIRPLFQRQTQKPICSDPDLYQNNY